jgi:hypothetical protein
MHCVLSAIKRYMLPQTRLVFLQSRVGQEKRANLPDDPPFATDGMRLQISKAP